MIKNVPVGERNHHISSFTFMGLTSSLGNYLEVCRVWLKVSTGVCLFWVWNVSSWNCHLTVHIIPHCKNLNLAQQPSHFGVYIISSLYVNSDQVVPAAQSSPINCEKRENLLPFVGLNNLGNTCYLNSILQVKWCNV